MNELFEKKVIGTVVLVSVQTDNRIEELIGIRQYVRLGVDGKDTVFNASLADAFPIVGRTDPKIVCPDLDAKLPGKEYRT